MTKTVTVGTLDNLETTTVNDAATVSDAFEARDMSAGAGEEYQDLNGNTLDGGEVVDAGQTYVIAESVKSGADDDGDEDE